MLEINKKNEPSNILADGRWQGANGIGRFSNEILKRLKHIDILDTGPNPLSIKNLFWQPYQLHQVKKKYRLYFTPGFNPVNYSPLPYILTICDLIYLYAPGNNRFLKKIFFETLVKSSVKKAHKILTISDYSKKTIIEWAGIPAEKVVNVGCGISQHFTPQGSKHEPGYSYLLHVGNTNSHKNVERLMTAFSLANIDSDIKLILTGTLTKALEHEIIKTKLQQRIVFSNTLSEQHLAEYYRGAIALVFPSLYEGFGLPVLEAMACGTPVMTSNITSLPEVAGNAALMINPYEIDSIRESIEKLVLDDQQRDYLIQQGEERVKLFSWNLTSDKIQTVLECSVS